MIKFPKDSTTIDISAYCDLCGDMVYTSVSTEEINTWNQKNPYICKTYKVYCERCYMTPLLKIKELVTLLEAYQENNHKKRRTRKVKTRVEKDKKTLDEINNEFY